MKNPIIIIVFTPVCQSFCSRGKGSASMFAGMADPPEQAPQEQTPPAQCMLGDMGNKRAVRILLECILVFRCQWRIQYFPEGGPELSRGGVNTPNFPENCMKSKEFGRPGGACVPHAPPRSANGCGSRIWSRGGPSF